MADPVAAVRHEVHDLRKEVATLTGNLAAFEGTLSRIETKLNTYLDRKDSTQQHELRLGVVEAETAQLKTRSARQGGIWVGVSLVLATTGTVLAIVFKIWGK